MKIRSCFLVMCCVAGGLVKVHAQVTATWTGAANTLWSNSNNWVSSSQPVPGSLIEFNSSGAGTSVLDVSLSSLESITFQNTSTLTLDATGGNTFNMSGGSNGVFFATNSNVALNVPISGSGTNLWLNGGTGTLTLNPGTGSNTFSGTTEVFAGGTLADGEANSYSANSVMYVGSVGSGTGTVLVNFNETIDGLNDGGPNGSVQIANGKTLTLTGVFSTTFSGVISDISGHGSLTMNGPGTLTLEGANSYSGTTTINSGGGINIGGGTSAGSIVSNVVGVGTGGISFDRSNMYFYGGILSGTLNVIQQGTGTTTLSGANVYTGPTTVIGGTLQAGSTSAFGGATGLGTMTVNGGTLSISGFDNTIGALNGSGNVSLGSNALTLASLINVGTFSGVIAGTGGTLVANGYVEDLTGANTYTGGTTINSGTLEVDNASGSGTGSGPVAIGASGTLQIGNGDANGSVASGVAINDNGVVDFFRNDAVTFPNSITGTGGVAMFGFLSETLTGTNVYSGETEIFRGTLIAGSTSAFGGTGLSPVVFDGVPANLNLAGFNNTVGSISGPSGNSINLGSGTLTIGGTSGSTTFSGVISGSGILDIAGLGGTTVLTGANTFTGGTTVNSGMLEVSAGSITQPLATIAVGVNAGDNGTLAVANGGTVSGEYSSTGYSAGSIGTISVDGAGSSVSISNYLDVGVYGAGNLSVTNGGAVNTPTLYIGYEAGSAGSLTIDGAGSSVSDSIYMDVGSYGNGTLAVTNGGAVNTPEVDIGYGAGTLGAVTVDGPGSNISATSEFNVGDLGFGSLKLSNGGTVNVGGGEGILTLGNSASGGGTLYMGGGSGSPAAAGILLASGVQTAGGTGTIIFNTTATSGSPYYFTNNGTSGGLPVNISGSIHIINNAGYNVLSGTNSFSGLTSINAGTIADGAANSFSPNSGMQVSSGGSLMVNHNEVVGDLENGTGNGQVTLASGTTLTTLGINSPNPFMGTISGAGGITIQTGSNYQGLGGASTYTGVTTMNGGELFIASSTVGAPGSITSGPVGTNTMVFTADTELSSLNTALTLANAINLNGFNLDNDDATTNLTITGPISGVGGSITWCTNNLLALINTNTFTGTVDMREGQLALGSDTGAGVGGTIILDSGTDLYTYGGPGITRTVANPVNFTGSAAALGNNDDNYLVLTGGISGSGDVAFQGGSTGTLTLSPSSNTFNGVFEIASGTVYAANNNAFGSTAAILLNGGTTLNVESGVTVGTPIIFSGSPNTLSGNGTISSAVVAGSSTILSPSASPGGGPGTLTFSSALVLGTGTAIHFDIYNATGAAGTGYSLINAPNGLDLTASNNTITFNIVSTNSTGVGASAINFNAAIPYSWMFASSPVTSGFSPLQFDLVTSGFTNSISGGGFSVSETGNNLFLNFTPVPEPSTWALMGAGVAALAGVGLRRRRSVRA